MITSKENLHFKKLVRLSKRREREKTQQFLVEGEREVSLAHGIEVLFYTDENQVVKEIREKGINTIQIAPDLFEKISYRDHGVIGVAKMSLTPLEELKDAKFLLVAESIEKPGNLGAMLRTCDAVNVDGVIICDPVVDLFSPNVIRASLGAFFTLKIARGSTNDVKVALRKWGVNPIVTTPKAKHSLFETDLTGPIAVVVGSESYGVTDKWLEDSEQMLIPMEGEVDSLNAACASGVVLYEAFRQRRTLSR